MILTETIKNYVPEPIIHAKRRLFRRSDGERVIRRRFRNIHGYDLDTTNARTFTEKLYRRMIAVNRNGNETFTRLADKYVVRDWVTETIGANYLIPMLWSGDDPEQIPFGHFPELCFAKTSHGSGGGIRVHPGIDRVKTVAALRHLLRQNHYWPLREFHYYPIRPRVLIEVLLDDGKDLGPLDYRVWCFHGEPRAIQVDNCTHTMNAFYTPQWKLTDATYRSASGIREAPRPENLDHLIEVAAKLSRPFDYVRVDLYSIKGKVYFGEMTFTPTGGQNKFDPLEWDLLFGEMWR
jgi:hypothetical protein